MIDSLISLHRRLTAALPMAGSRQLEDGPTAAELALEATFAARLESVLEELYRYPLRRGLANVPDENVQAWMREQLADPEATAVLVFVLMSYLPSAFDVGGQMALDELGIDAIFQLQDDEILDAIEAFATDTLADIDGDMSLTRTTADELATQVEAGREDGLTNAALSAALATFITSRSLTRSVAIANTETVRFSRFGMSTTFNRNGVGFMELRNMPGACRICSGLEGERYPTTAGGVVVGPVPIHPGCYCYYVALIESTELPEEVWTGEGGYE